MAAIIYKTMKTKPQTLGSCCFNFRSLGIPAGIAVFLAIQSTMANSAIEPAESNNAFHQRFLARAEKGNIDVLFLGDSITQYWGDPDRGLPVWEREFAPLSAANFGINGNRLQHVLWRLLNGEAVGYAPQVVVLLVGTNNTTPRNSTVEVVEGITAVVDELKARFPQTKILLLGIFPRDTKEHRRRLQILDINRSISKLGDNQQVFYLDIGDRFLDSGGEIPPDLMPDALHPSLKGYEIFAAAIKGPLERLLHE